MTHSPEGVWVSMPYGNSTHSADRVALSAYAGPYAYPECNAAMANQFAMYLCRTHVYKVLTEPLSGHLQAAIV